MNDNISKLMTAAGLNPQVVQLAGMMPQVYKFVSLLVEDIVKQMPEGKDRDVAIANIKKYFGVM